MLFSTMNVAKCMGLRVFNLLKRPSMRNIRTFYWPSMVRNLTGLAVFCNYVSVSSRR